MNKLKSTQVLTVTILLTLFQSIGLIDFLEKSGSFVHSVLNFDD
jgi:hypothetical protein